MNSPTRTTLPLIEPVNGSADRLNHVGESAVRDMDELLDEDFVIPPAKYEYLDHTADVQLHAWGDTLKEAFEQCAIAMFGYMTDLARVQISQVHQVEAEGHDLDSLLFHFLDELLFLFSAEPYIVSKKVKITEFDTQNFKIKVTAYGEEFTIGKHTQGAEVKAITYSAMQIHDSQAHQPAEVFVIVDI